MVRLSYEYYHGNCFGFSANESVFDNGMGIIFSTEFFSCDLFKMIILSFLKIDIRHCAITARAITTVAIDVHFVDFLIVTEYAFCSLINSRCSLQNATTCSLNSLSRSIYI